MNMSGHLNCVAVAAAIYHTSNNSAINTISTSIHFPCFHDSVLFFMTVYYNTKRLCTCIISVHLTIIKT